MALADFQRIDRFSDAATEASACRSACALFDFSFLECAQIRGGAARRVVESFAGRPLADLPVGKICYALRVDESGFALADLTIWRTEAETFEVMSGRDEDITELLNYAANSVAVTKVGDRATFAVQGPIALEALSRVGRVDALGALPYFGFTDAALDGIPCRIGRLGYTGEAGFEIICPKGPADRLWRALVGCAQPAGFIALDMLRIEAGFVLFSNEFRLPVTPDEAGLGRFYQDKPLRPPTLELVSFVADAGRLTWPWQPGAPLSRPSRPEEIAVTSACNSVVAGGILGLGYVFAGRRPGALLHDPSGIFRNVRQTPLPYYDTAKRRPRLAWRYGSDLDVGSRSAKPAS
jgi:glycine cleavage system aminomethyltransferase T